MKENPKEFAAIKNLIEQYYERGVEFLYEDTPISKKRAYHLFSSAITLFQALEISEKEELNEVHNKLRSRLKKMGDMFVNPSGSERNPERKLRIPSGKYCKQGDVICGFLDWNNEEWFGTCKLFEGNEILTADDKDEPYNEVKKLDECRTEYPKGGLINVSKANPLGVRGGATIEQAVLFDMDSWTKSTAKKWLKAHKKKYGRILEPKTGRYLHAVQIPSAKLKKDITTYRVFQPRGFPAGVKLRLGIRKGAPRRNPMDIMREPDSSFTIAEGTARDFIIEYNINKSNYKKYIDDKNYLEEYIIGMGGDYTDELINNVLNIVKEAIENKPRRNPVSPIRKKVKRLRTMDEKIRVLVKDLNNWGVETSFDEIKKLVEENPKLYAELGEMAGGSYIRDLFVNILRPDIKTYGEERGSPRAIKSARHTRRYARRFLKHGGRSGFVDSGEPTKLNPLVINPMTQNEALKYERRANPGLLVVNPLTPKTAKLVNPIKPGSYLIDDPKNVYGIYVANIYDSAGYIEDGVGATKREAMKSARAKVKQLML